MRRSMKKRDGVAEQMRRIFETNPDEELTYDFCVEKFCRSRRTIQDAVYQLRDEGLIESLHVIRAVPKNAKL